MECRAEINRFAIFLFCLLVPLGSMAPTKTSESKVTAGQVQNHFTADIPSMAIVIQRNAQKLFKFYNDCIAATFYPEPWRVVSEGRDLADRIPTCPAFQTSCCALHHIRSALLALGADMETICTPSSKGPLLANLSQLNTTLSQGTAFYTCTSHHLAQVYPQGTAEIKTYIWWVLKKYEDIMRQTGNLYLEEGV